MLRIIASSIPRVVRNNALRSQVVVAKRYGHGQPELTEEEFDNLFVTYFKRPDMDGFLCRNAMNKLAAQDVVPSPPIVIEALKACRKLNDYALAVRFLESVKDKCGDKVDEIYPYILQEIKPTLDELGIDTPEGLGYDKPELALKSVDDM